MRKAYLWTYLLATCLTAAQGYAQTPGNAEEYKAALRTIHDESSRWATVIESVETEKLNPSYQMGKLIDEGKYTVLTNIGIAQKWADEESVRPSLYAEVNLYDAVKELRVNLGELSNDLVVFQLSDDPSRKLQLKWSKAVQDLANDRLVKLERTMMTYTAGHALAVDRACRYPGAR